jgi:hypothetical protein
MNGCVPSLCIVFIFMEVLSVVMMMVEQSWKMAELKTPSYVSLMMRFRHLCLAGSE